MNTTQPNRSVSSMLLLKLVSKSVMNTASPKSWCKTLSQVYDMFGDDASFQNSRSGSPESTENDYKTVIFRHVVPLGSNGEGAILPHFSIDLHTNVATTSDTKQSYFDSLISSSAPDIYIRTSYYNGSPLNTDPGVAVLPQNTASNLYPYKLAQSAFQFYQKLSSAEDSDKAIAASFDGNHTVSTSSGVITVNGIAEHYMLMTVVLKTDGTAGSKHVVIGLRILSRIIDIIESGAYESTKFILSDGASVKDAYENFMRNKKAEHLYNLIVALEKCRIRADDGKAGDNLLSVSLQSGGSKDNSDANALLTLSMLTT